MFESMQIRLSTRRRRKQKEKRTEFAEKPRFARNRRILQETEQDLPGGPQSPLQILSSLAHSRRNELRHANCLHNARSITKCLGTRQYINPNPNLFYR